jgi:hypothetical protein
MRHLATFCVAVCVSGAALLAACAGTPEPKAPEPEPEPPKQERPKHGPSVSQELGSIDEAATKKTFERLTSKMVDCQKEGIRRLEYLAGDVKFFLRIGQDGRVRYAYLEDSTLGDRDTEKCILGVLNDAQWPRPEEGEAEVRNGMGFDSADARPPTDWPSDKIALVLAKQSDEALKCKEGVKGSFRVTAYVVPGAPEGEHAEKNDKKGRGKHAGNHAKEHGKEGHVEAVGVAPPNKDGEAKVDCIVDAVKEWHMPSPGSYAAKVTFTL